MKRCRGRVIKKRRVQGGVAWLLTFVMICSLVMVPADKVQAESVTVTGTEVVTPTDTGVYVSYTSELEFAAGVWGDSPAVDLYKYAFTLHNNTDTTISDWSVRIIPNSNAYWNSGWNGVTYDSSSGAVILGTYKGTGNDGSTWSTAEVEAGATVTGMGAQCRANIFDGATIELTYNIGGSTQAPSVDDTATDPSIIGTTSDKVTAIVTQSSQSYDYYQYEIAVNNGLSENISDWIVVIPASGITSSSAWDGNWAKVKWSYDNSYVYVTSNCNETITAGGSISGESYKIQYNGSTALSTSEAKVYYKTGSSSTGAFDSVIAGGTQPSGGSSSGGGSSTGEIFDGSNIGTIDTSLDYNFAKLLQYSLYFYDANMCGDKVSETSLYSKDLYNGWRGDCHVNDKFTYNGKTYSAVGGFHDAGDHVKFGLPMSQAMTALGMSYYEYGQAFDELNQKNHLKTITDYYCTYVKSCTVLNEAGTQAEAFCYQVGDGNADHASWVAPEVENESATNRTYTLVATSSNPATDIVSGTAAALALNYLNFGNEEDLKYAKALFAFAKSVSAGDRREADYQTSKDGGNFYHSGYGEWQDEYCLAAALLYKITEDETYATEYNSNESNTGDIEKPYGWENAYHAAVFYAPSNSPTKSAQTTTIRNWFNAKANASSNSYYLGDSWGSARVNCNVQFMMMVSDKHAGTNTYGSWCRYQMSQILGNNSTGKNLVCGYNTNSPKKPHHRAASGYSGWDGGFNSDSTQKYTLYGALCGGPTTSNFSSYVDSVKDAVSNEVALDYNACFVGSAAALYLLYKDCKDAGFTNQTIHPDFYGGSNFSGAGEEENTINPTGVTLDATSKDLVIGNTFTLKATVAPEGASQKVIWSSSDESVATVNSSGVVTAKSKGTATITATTVAMMESGVAATATCEVKVKTPANLVFDATTLKCPNLTYGYPSASAVLEKVQNTGEVATTPSSVELESGNYFSFVQKPTNTIEAGAYASVEVMPKAGLAAGTYTDKVIIRYDGKALEIPVSVTVVKKPITIKAQDATKAYGETNPVLSVDLSYEDDLVRGDSISYTMTTTATTASDVGEYPIYVQAADSANYDVTVEEGTLTITPKEISRVNFPTAAALKVGQSLADSTLSGGSVEYGSFAWKDTSIQPPKGTNAYGVVLSLSDNAIKNYSFGGIDGYDGSKGTITQSVVVNVTRADLPDVIFPTATAIVYGDTLEQSSLVGGSTQYGSFKWADSTYTPTITDIASRTIQQKVIFTWSEACKAEYALEEDEMTLEQMVTVEVKKQDNTKLADTPTLAKRTYNRITITEVDGVEYSKDGETWQTSGVFAGLSACTAYKIYARYAETATQYAGEICTSPLEVYTLVQNPYLVDVSRFVGENVEQYVEVFYNEEGTQTIHFDEQKNVLTLMDEDGTYTIIGNNKNIVVTVPNGEGTDIILNNATIKKLDVTKYELDSDAMVDVVVAGTVFVDEIISDSENDVLISGEGILNVSEIVAAGRLEIDGPVVTMNTTGTAVIAREVIINTIGITIDARTGIVAEENVVIKGYDVTISCGSNGTGIVAGESVEIKGNKVTVTCGDNSAGIVANENVTISDVDLVVTGGAGEPAINSAVVNITGATVIATGGKGASAIEIADSNGTLTINNADVKVTAGEGSQQSAIQADNIIISNDSKISSDGDLEKLYSSVPKDENGNKIVICTVLLYEEDGTTQILKKSFYGGTQFILPEIEPQTGCIMSWKDKDTGTSYEPKTAITVNKNMTFVVYAKKIKVTSITLNSTDKIIGVGPGLTLTAAVKPSNAYDCSVTWTSSNPEVATVDEKGNVTGVSLGTAVITATANDGSGKSASCTITVVEAVPKDVAVEKVKITGATKKVAPGKKLKLKAAVYPLNATNTKVFWKVSNAKYASVNSKGLVTTKKAGRGKKVTVTAYSVEDNSIKATYKISIMKNPVKKIKLSAKTTTLKKGKSVTVKAQFTPTKGISKELSWTSSNSKIATVNAKGKVTGKKKGTVKITAKAKDGSGKKATIRIRVK